MLWSFFFAIGLLQGLFLVVVFSVRKSPNPLAARLLLALLVLFTLSNLDDLLLATQWYVSVPWLFGTSMASMFAYGPLFYCYINSITNPPHAWKWINWLHFAPALLFFLLYLPMFFMAPEAKIDMLQKYRTGAYRIENSDVVFQIARQIHFGIYLFGAYRLVRKAQASTGATSFRVPILRRTQWLYALLILFALILAALVVMFAWNFSSGHFLPNAQFGFTLITSSIMYFIAYKMMLQPELVTPDFSKKYRTVRMEEGEEQYFVSLLKQLIDSEKVFLDPDLNLNAFAAKMEIAPHRLSMLINDRFGKSFSDFIAQQRVAEFIARINDPRFANYSLYGLALDVGFNSKSAFNAAFKKITGKTPSDYKKQ